MERFHPICDARSRVSRNICHRAERLARSGAIPGMDAEDIKQDLRLHLYRRDAKFDPSRGQYDTFADRVLANRIATLAAPTERLRVERAWIDFDTPSEGRGDDAVLALAETLPESAAPHAGSARSPDEAFGLVRDVRRFLAGLTPACRDLALALIDMSPTEAAQALGIHRSTVYARLGTIRKAAEALDLAAYLGTAPTVPDARR
ncbi:helix-turn-helix domain-containing protein [Rhodobacter sp. CZR27]|uniref:helix-turn-helix domain-containing protein n=1 Tax=Rhodobacter sp. CZR27 TaxID=2033869 RepID=UPI000BBE15F2|nr:helix-turn-helix domain-containing protein [Rhodobacter sp. CZR27]